MEFNEVLRGRRMVRHYRPDPVPPEILQQVVRVVRRAPSAGYSQGHRLVVITDPAVRGHLAAVAEPWYLEHGHQPWISQAPVHIALGIREASYHERYTESDKLTDGAEIPWPVPFWWFDAGALFMLLQLAAIDAGLTTGFYSPAPPEQLDALAKIAQLPDDVALVGILTLGYPADPDAEPNPRLTDRRKPLEELVVWRD
ncbi:nitroreductase family protein [Nocardia brasiliensis]|uniref:nitroreductase family protein n=1 Tax=Nocardia brasiliensis TaxID=37326 RepID=UPI003D909760